MASSEFKEKLKEYEKVESRAMNGDDDDDGYKVELYVYDMSKGIAKAMSPSILGKQIEGIWHTGVVAYGREYFFGAGGIESCRPGGTILGEPERVEDLGKSQVPYQLFLEYIFGLGDSSYKPGAYDLFKNNCNNFSEEVSQFLCGRAIPKNILTLPDEVLNTSIGGKLSVLLKNLKLKSEGIAFSQVNNSIRGYIPKEVTRHSDDPEFDALNSAIEELRHNTQILENRRSSLNEKLLKKERREKRKEKKEKKRKKRDSEGEGKERRSRRQRDSVDLGTSKSVSFDLRQRGCSEPPALTPLQINTREERVVNHPPLPPSLPRHSATPPLPQSLPRNSATPPLPPRIDQHNSPSNTPSPAPTTPKPSPEPTSAESVVSSSPERLDHLPIPAPNSEKSSLSPQSSLRPSPSPDMDGDVPEEQEAPPAPLPEEEDMVDGASSSPPREAPAVSQPAGDIEPDAEAEVPREPPIVFKEDTDTRADFDGFVSSCAEMLSADEQKHMEELRAYVIEDEGSWALGEDFNILFARVFHDPAIPDEARYYMLRIMAAAALKDDVILMLHQDRREHTIMNFANKIESFSCDIQESIALFFCNMFEHLSPSEWLLYISEWAEAGQQISNIRVTTKVAVNALLHQNSKIQDYGTALMYNLGTKEVKTVVFDDVAPELAMAILQFFSTHPQEEFVWRTITALCKFCYASSEVPMLIKMIGPEPNCFKGMSERVDSVIDEINGKLERVRAF